MTKKLFGILGGMGPSASLHLCQLITQMTPASKDQDHLPYLLYNNPQIPDRTASIFGKGPSPIKDLKRSVQTLEDSQCQFIAIPCNTAHHYIEELQLKTKRPIINMITETVNEISKNYSTHKKIGLLATSGTLKVRLFEKHFGSSHFKIITPSEEIQESIVMTAIYQIKQGKNLEQASHTLKAALDFFLAQEVHLIIAGCTEVSLALHSDNPELVIIDPIKILAKKIIDLSTKLKK